VKVQDVELVGPAPHPVEHKHVIGKGVFDRWIQTECLAGARHQFGAAEGVAAGKQRDRVSLTNELFGEPEDHSFGSPIEAGWNAFHQWSDLRDFHHKLSNGEGCGGASEMIRLASRRFRTSWAPLRLWEI
jgi:hypothetical protein